MQGQGKVGWGENRQGFDQNIGDGFFAREVGIELVAENFNG